jgi:hypothetical protein
MMKTCFAASNRMCFFASACLCVIISACSAFADGLSQYRDFIANPPLIKKMLFAQSGNLHPSQIEDEKLHDTPGFVLFSAAMQSNSWFLEIVTNAPLGGNDPRMGNGFAVGESFTNYWAVYSNKKGVIVCPFDASENSPLKGITSIWLKRIQMVQKLGLIYLEPRKNPDIPPLIRWIDNSSFEAKTAEHGIMKGKVVELTNGFPQKVELNFSEIPNTIFSVVYSYETNRSFPPSGITASKTTGKNTEQLWQFLLPDIETGDLGPDFRGFSTENFISSIQMVSAKKFIENGESVLVISSNGLPIKLPRTKPDYSVLQLRITLPPKEYRAVRIFIWFFMVGSVAILFWLVKKTKK